MKETVTLILFLVALLKPLQDAVNCIQLRCLTYEISMHLRFICMYTMEWYSLLYDFANGTRFIYRPTKSVRNKIKAFIWINSKSGTYNNIANEMKH